MSEPRDEDFVEHHYWRAIDLWSEDPDEEVLKHLQLALARSPKHIPSLVLLGELYLLRDVDTGLSEDTRDQIALACFERALECEPRHAEAWSCKALALLYAGRHSEALAAADTGRDAVASLVGQGMTNAEIRLLVRERLWDVRILALIGLERFDLARRSLEDGLHDCPQSTFLSRHCSNAKLMPLVTPVGEQDAAL